MATSKLSEKPVVTILDDEVRIFITTKEDVDGDKVDSIRRTTFPAFIEMLKANGIDKSHFDEMRYDADTGMLHIMLNSKDVIAPCYIGKFAEVNENGVIPDKFLPEFNKGGTLYANNVPLYGTRFVDVTEDGEIIIREDGSGDYLLTLLEDGTAMAVKVKTHVVNSLDNDSETKALSAKQGKILAGFIGKVGELLTTTKTNVVEAINELFNSLDAHKNAANNPHAVSKSQIGLDNVDNVKQASKADFEAHTSNTANPHKVTKAQVGLGNAENTADKDKEVLSATKLKTARKINGVDFDGTGDITIEDNTKIPLSQKGAAGGIATLNDNGQVPAAQLPSYVDDTIEGTLATFPKPGESGKIYVDTDTGLTYRWSGSQYVEISKSLALGETSSTAYPGNKGKESAEKIAELQKTSADHTEDIKNLEENKAGLVGGVVPDAQLPHYNKSQNIYVGDKLLYPVVFFDVDSEGNFYLREDGRGEYLLYIPLDGVPRLKYIGNAVTDDVTGVSYSFSISDGKAVLKQIL